MPKQRRLATIRLPMSRAQRTGDAAPRALARTVLLEFGDTLFLRKLEDVATHM